MKFSIVIFLSIAITACNKNAKFNKTQWQVKSDIGEFPNRNSMINDLLSSYKLTGVSYKKLIELIGEPERNIEGKKNEMHYQILTEYSSDIDPISSKILVVKLNNDSIVINLRIDEWEK